MLEKHREKEKNCYYSEVLNKAFSEKVWIGLERWVAKWVGEMGKNMTIPRRNDDGEKVRLWGCTSWLEKDESFGEAG